MHYRPSIEPRPVLALQHNQLAATNDSVQRFQYLSKPLGFLVVGAVGFLLTWKTETQKKLSGIETKQKNHLWEKEGHPDKKNLSDFAIFRPVSTFRKQIYLFFVDSDFEAKARRWIVSVSIKFEKILICGEDKKKKNSRHRLKKSRKRIPASKSKTRVRKKHFFEWRKICDGLMMEMSFVHKTRETKQAYRAAGHW